MNHINIEIQPCQLSGAGHIGRSTIDLLTLSCFFALLSWEGGENNTGRNPPQLQDVTGKSVNFSKKLIYPTLSRSCCLVLGARRGT